MAEMQVLEATACCRGWLKVCTAAPSHTAGRRSNLSDAGWACWNTGSLSG